MENTRHRYIFHSSWEFANAHRIESILSGDRVILDQYKKISIFFGVRRQIHFMAYTDMESMLCHQVFTDKFQCKACQFIYELEIQRPSIGVT